jgi:hypothetical protein
VQRLGKLSLPPGGRAEPHMERERYGAIDYVPKSRVKNGGK